MTARRTVLRAAGASGLLGVMSGCSSSGSTGTAWVRPASGRSSVPGPISVETRLAPVHWSDPPTQVSTWRQELTSAADVVERHWGAMPGSVVITSCDDEAFAAVSDGLDAGTAAVTTTSGIYLGPAFQRALTGLGRSVVLAHELTHARLGQFGGDRTAWWLKEGSAEWTAGFLAPGLSAAQRWPNLHTAWRRRQALSGPPERADTGTALGYEWAHAYVSYLVDTCTSAAVTALVRSRPSDATSKAAALCAGKTSFVTWLDHTFA